MGALTLLWQIHLLQSLSADYRLHFNELFKATWCKKGAQKAISPQRASRWQACQGDKKNIIVNPLGTAAPAQPCLPLPALRMASRKNAAAFVKFWEKPGKHMLDEDAQSPFFSDVDIARSLRSFRLRRRFQSQLCKRWRMQTLSSRFRTLGPHMLILRLFWLKCHVASRSCFHARTMRLQLRSGSHQKSCWPSAAVCWITPQHISTY